MRTYYIYKYTNTKNNKIYIGQCFNIDQRKRAHKSAALNGSNSCLLFYRGIREHGYENFTFEILETIFTDQKGIDEREVYWIKFLDSRNVDIGMNISPGGGGRANPNNTDTHKQCYKCGEIKLRTEFTKESSTHDGIRTYCKVCGLKIDQEYRNNLSEEELERRNKIRRDNYTLDPDKQIEQSKKYYSEHKEERAEYSKIYAEEHAEEIAIKSHERYEADKDNRILTAKEQRIKDKEVNEKLGAAGICARTPIKRCNACLVDMSSTEFYIDLTASNGLSRNCKTCHKAKMAINREKARKNKGSV